MVHIKKSSSNDDVMLYTSDKKARLLLDCTIWSYKAIYS